MLTISNKKYLEKALKDINTVYMSGEKLIASTNFVINIVKATGLKSKKTRKVNKRFKLIMNKVLREYFESLDI